MKYTITIASLKAATADIQQLDAKNMSLNGKDISDHVSDVIADNKTDILDQVNLTIDLTKTDIIDQVNETIEENKIVVLDERGTLANDELDIWNSSVTKDANNNVIINTNAKPFEHTFDSISSTQYTTIKSVVKVIDNEVLGANDAHLMYWLTDGLTNGSNMFLINSNLTTFSSDLSSLSNSDHMFSQCTNLTTFNSDLLSLTNGTGMFAYCYGLTSFTSDLPNLTNGSDMFFDCWNLTSFNYDLSNLTYGLGMFTSCHNLTFFSSNLSNLTNGCCMFSGCHNLAAFTSDLPKMANGDRMFLSCENLTTFNSDLYNLTDGTMMFNLCYNLKSFTSDLYSLMDGWWMFYKCTNLTTFSSNLSSLTDGRGMFHNCKLDALSVANILQSLSTHESNGTIVIGVGIDNTDEARQAIAEAIWCKDWNEVNLEFTNKNWIVEWQFNGAPTSAATLDIDNTTSPIWAKVEEVIADENGNLPHYSYVSEDGSKYFNLHWYHSSNGNNEGYEYFGSLLEACGYFGIVPKEYSEQN